MRAIIRTSLSLSCAALFLLAGCKEGEQAKTSGDDLSNGIPRSKTLYLAGSQWGDPSTFNPLAESWQAAWPVSDRFNLMYEPLINYNSLTGQVEPCLGTLVSKDADSIVLDLNPAAKWSDGQPVTSADVKFIYDIGRRFKGAATGYAIEFISGINVDTVDANGTKVERISFLVDKKGRNNPLVILDLLQAIRIVPAHVFEALLASHNNDLAEVQKLKIDSVPVVSGPYNLETYSNEKIVIKRRDDYWGNAVLHNGQLPVPEYIVHPIFKSNDHFAIALQKGEIDASQTFIPRIWMKKKDNVGTWYEDAPFFVPGSMPLLLINTTKAPMNDKVFRRAMAAAINYADVKELAISGYAPDLQPGLIMPTVLEGKFINQEDLNSVGVRYNPETAKKMLADAGYKSVFKADGVLDYMVDKTGKKLPTLYIKCPAGWSDWEAMVTIAVKSLRAAGIDAREGFVDAGLYWPALPSGDFDLIMHKPAAAITPSLPWSRFEAVMSSRNWKPVGGGNSMNENQGRYNNPGAKDYNPKVDSLLKLIPLLSDEAALKMAYAELNKIFMEDQPAIPLSYSPEQFYEFSSAHWTNWPTAKNSYAPPQLPMVSAGTNILWQLKPAE
ncbi:MAG TPA: ABC transporter substrate-binding protein [Fibrobacteraceae bacterium]|nr:ABC transporter substrate-binding protein [Fibrobacteraceae bacterium]